MDAKQEKKKSYAICRIFFGWMSINEQQLCDIIETSLD